MSAQKSHVRTIGLVLLITGLFAFFIIYFGMIRPSLQPKEIQIDGTYLSASTPINDFKLTDNHGNPFTHENLIGHWTMLFFGFTNCGMVCPTTMASLSTMYKTLQAELPDQKLPQIVFISVDPDRDSVSRVNEYVTAFNPHFMGARGEITDTVALEKQLHIVAAKIQVDGMGKDNYTINHSAEILLVNPQGKLQAYFSFPHAPDQMVKDYKLIINHAIS